MTEEIYKSEKYLVTATPPADGYGPAVQHYGTINVERRADGFVLKLPTTRPTLDVVFDVLFYEDSKLITI